MVAEGGFSEAVDRHRMAVPDDASRTSSQTPVEMRPLVFAFAAHGATGELGARASCAFALPAALSPQRPSPAARRARPEQRRPAQGGLWLAYGSVRRSDAPASKTGT